MQPLKVQRDNELESWGEFMTRFGVATIGMAFKDKLKQGDTTDQSEEEQKNKGGSLLNAMGEEGMQLFLAFDIKVEEIKYDDLVAKFEAHFTGRENKIILRHRFLSCKQEEDERIVA
jgi:hypothetical protein